MKIAMVLLAAVALIGSAAAWDYIDWTTYESGRIGYVQGGDPLDQFIERESGTYFSGTTPYGNTEGAVFNRLSGENQGWPTAGSNVMYIEGEEPSQTLTLTQSGGAYTIARAPDNVDGLPIIEAGIRTDQNLNFNGYYQGANTGVGNSAVWAQFESAGNAGVEGEYVLTSFTNLESATGRAQPGMIETSAPDTFFTSADIGMASTAGMTVDEICGVTFSGSVTSFAGFDGGRGTGVIEANAGGFENHVMVLTQNNPQIITEGLAPPNVGVEHIYPWQTVQNQGYGFPYW